MVLEIHNWEWISLEAGAGKHGEEEGYDALKDWGKGI